MLRAIIAALTLAAISASAQGVIGKTATSINGGHRIDAQTDGARSVMPQSLYADCVLWQTFSYSDNSDADFYDLTTFANNGTQTTAASQPTFSSANGGTYDFDGIDDTIDIDTTLGETANDTAGTFAAWVMITNIATFPGVGQIVSYEDAGVAEYVQWRIDNAGPAGRMRAICFDGGVSRWTLNTTNAVVSDNVWSHLALVQDGTSPVVYANGLQVPQTFTALSDKTMWFSRMTGVDRARIGSMTAAQFFDGNIDDVRVYSRALTSNEVFTIYNTTKGTYGL